MPGLGLPEMLFIFVAALLLFGPRRLPELGKTLGKGLAELRKASNELKRSLDAEGLEKDLRETREAIRQVDPRRYLEEAMETDDEVGRVARRQASDAETDADADADAKPIAGSVAGEAAANEDGEANDASQTLEEPTADTAEATDEAAPKVTVAP